MLPSEIFQNFADANFGLQAKIIDQEEKLQKLISTYALFLRKLGLKMAGDERRHTCVDLIRLT